MVSFFRPLAFLLLAALMAVSAFAQTGTTTGEINGTVSDSSGATLPGVTVTALNKDTGLTRTTYTESSGQYTVSLLPPGSYRVTAELTGLGTTQRDNIQVKLGQAANVNLSLNPQVSEEITVTADSPVVDTTQSAAQEAVSQEQIENLPLLGRDFKDLVALTPGVAPSFGGRVALVGARGTATDYNIDGANANSDFFAEERGGTSAPYVFSQAAIREFQVIRTTYSAEYSRGGGGTMNAITKSGTNEFSGEAFYFLRDKDWATLRTLPSGFEESFDARDVDQYGFAIGGPIIRDELFFFANGDFQDIEEEFTTSDIRNNSTFTALPTDQRAALVSRIESLLGTSLDTQFVYPTLENQDTWLAKIDWNIGNANHANIRWNRSDFNNFPSEFSGSLSNQGDEYNTVDSYVGQTDSIIGNSMYNFALVQYSLEERPINPLSTDQPQFGVRLGSTTFTFGQRDFLPNGTDEEKWEIKDTFSWMIGNHQIRTGGNYLTVDISNLFVRDRSGDFFFANVADFLANRPQTFEQGLGRAGSTGATVFDFNQWGVFIMDTWKPISQLTLDFGVRYDAQSMPVPDQNRYEATQPLLDDWFREDTDNVAPRLGFAYDIFNTGKSVLRGGVGKYYNFVPAILMANPIQQISGLFTNYRLTCSATVQCPTFPNIFTPEQLQNASSVPVVDIATVSPDLEAAESWRGSLGYEQELWRGYSVEVEGIYARHEKQQRFINANAVPTGLMFGDLVNYSVTNPARRFPQFNNVRMHVSDAEGKYTAATIAFRKIALNSNLSWLAHYTWSESIDQDTNSRSTSTSFHYDPYDPKASEGPSDNDVEHRVVASATYQLPWGFFVSGIFNWRTGQPYTRSIDTGSSSSFNPLIGFSAVGVKVPVFVDSSGQVIDLSQASGSTATQFADFLNSRGARMIGRNTENQPDFTNLDLRLSKRFGLPRGFAVELIGEVFNVLNEKSEFITTSNQSEFILATSGSAGPNQKFNITRNANYGKANGFDFNSPPRQYQAAVKFHF